MTMPPTPATESTILAAERPRTDPRESIHLLIEPGKVLRLMLATVLLLILNHVGIRLLELYAGAGGTLFSVYAQTFTVNAEGMVPTMYSTVALLFASALLLVNGFATKKSGGRQAVYWFGLAAIFAFLAMDEALEIHEKLSDPMRAVVPAGGIFHFAWVIPYGVFALVVGAVYVPFLFNLPKKTRVNFIMAGCTYVSGALGMELVGGAHAEIYGTSNLRYVMFSTLEELLEMGGIIISSGLSSHLAQVPGFEDQRQRLNNQTLTGLPDYANRPQPLGSEEIQRSPNTARADMGLPLRKILVALIFSPAKPRRAPPRAVVGLGTRAQPAEP
jgi:hypothetical protein